MKYLVDFSTLRSAAKGLGNWGFHRYMRESGTEGLTQLLDISRLVDLVVLSDELLVSQRIADANMPDEVSRIVQFISLENSPAYFDDMKIRSQGLTNLKSDVSKLEKLLEFNVVNDFVHEIEEELIATDIAFVQTIVNELSKRFAFLKKYQDSRLNDPGSQVFYTLFARTLQYFQTADLESIPYVCHAYRSPIVRMLHKLVTRSEPQYFNLYDECENKLKLWLRENFGDDSMEFNLPMFFVAVLRETKSAEELFKIAWQFRETKEAVKIRQSMTEIRDEKGRVYLQRCAELRRIADEQMKSFQKSYAVKRIDDESKASPLSVQLSFSATSISPTLSVDLLKLGKGLARWLYEWKDQRSVALIFKMARKTYELLSIDDDLERIWGIRLTGIHKNLLRQISERCDV